MNLILDRRAELESFLSQFRGEKVLFIPNEGNAGDCFLLAATLQALEKASIEVEMADAGSDMDGRTVFLGGGGNLVGLYREMRTVVEAAQRSRAARVVLLPQTIRANEDLIGTLDSRFTVWCRETRSQDHVRATNPRVDCHLGHDMAFHSDVAEFIDNSAYNDLGTRLLSDGLRRANTSIEQLGRQPVVHFMRTDREARHSTVAGDLDVSRIFGGVADLTSSRLTAWCFLKTISAANRIVTDRLHVAIACALLGKECELHDNSYSKNRDIYAHSLSDFPSVTFAAARGPPLPDAPPVKRSMRARALRHARQFLQKRLLGKRQGSGADAPR